MSFEIDISLTCMGDQRWAMGWGWPHAHGEDQTQILSDLTWCYSVKFKPPSWEREWKLEFFSIHKEVNLDPWSLNTRIFMVCFLPNTRCSCFGDKKVSIRKDVYRYKKALYQIYPATSVKRVPYGRPSSYQEMLWGWSMLSIVFRSIHVQV